MVWRMAVDYTLQVNGLEEVVEAVAKAEVTFRSKALGGLMRRAVQPFIRKMKQMAPKGETGNLQRSVGVEIERYPSAWVAIVGPKWPRGAHSANVAFGHGGPSPAPPHDYVTPVRVSEGPKVQQRIEELIQKELEKALGN